MENDNAISLIKYTITELRRQRIILPGITTIEKLVSDSISMADERIIIINENLTREQKFSMAVLINSQSENTTAKLGWIREEIGHASPKSFIEVIKRIEEIRKLNLNMNIERLHPNRICQLSRIGAKYEPHSFRRFEEDKRYAILAVYLFELCQNLIDKAIEIHDGKYTPLLLISLKFKSTSSTVKPLIEAINILNVLNETGKRRMPDDIPIDFIPTRWTKCVLTYSIYSR